MKQESPASRGGSVKVPSGAVVAFNNARCPDGWSEFTESQGRFILGVEAADNLTPRNLLAQGGKEQYFLNPQQIPKHEIEFKEQYFDNENNLRYKTETGNSRDKVKVIKTKDEYQTNAEAPIASMPPFVVLRFCQKQ